MGSDRGSWPEVALRRLHARGFERAEVFALLLMGTVSTAGFGYNLSQLLLHGRLWIYMRRQESYWALWADEPGTIVRSASLTALGFGAGVSMLAVLALYWIAVTLWGPHRPGYKDKPPLSLD